MILIHLFRVNIIYNRYDIIDIIHTKWDDEDVTDYLVSLKVQIEKMQMNIHQLNLVNNDQKEEMEYLKNMLIEQEEVLYARTRTDLNNEMQYVRDNLYYLDRSVASIQKNYHYDFETLKFKLSTLELV